MNERRNLIAAIAVAAAAMVTGIVTAAIFAPSPSIADGGGIVFCSDLGYPPMESLQGTRPVGADIDIGSAIAKSMHVKAQFKNVGFDGIIAARLAKKCDAILAAMTDTAQRRKQVSLSGLRVGGLAHRLSEREIVSGTVPPDVRDHRLVGELVRADRLNSQATPAGYGPLDPWAYPLIRQAREDGAGRSPTAVPEIQAGIDSDSSHSVAQSGAGQGTAAPSGVPNGFDWRDAGIGAATTLAAVLVAFGSTLLIRRRAEAGARRPSRHALGR